MVWRAILSLSNQGLLQPSGQIFQVGQILQTASGLLVDFKMSKIDDVNLNAIESIDNFAGVAFIKFHA